MEKELQEEVRQQEFGSALDLKQALLKALEGDMYWLEQVKTLMLVISEIYAGFERLEQHYTHSYKGHEKLKEQTQSILKEAQDAFEALGQTQNSLRAEIQDYSSLITREKEEAGTRLNEMNEAAKINSQYRESIMRDVSDILILRDELNSKLGHFGAQFEACQNLLKSINTQGNHFLSSIDAAREELNPQRLSTIEEALTNGADGASLQEIRTDLEGIRTSLANKVDGTSLEEMRTDLEGIRTSLANKVDSASLEEMRTDLENKADSTSLENIEGRIEEVRRTIDDIEDAKRRFEENMRAIDNHLQNTETQISSRLITLDTRYNTLLTEINAIKTNINATNTKLTSAVNQMNTTTSRISAITVTNRAPNTWGLQPIRI